MAQDPRRLAPLALLILAVLAILLAVGRQYDLELLLRQPGRMTQ